MPRVAVASSKTNGTKREWCPGSLESPATLRRSGRTETLTEQASHTNSSAKGRRKEQKERGRNIGAAIGEKGLSLARTSCGEVRSLLALQTLRSGSWLSGIRSCTSAFRRRIPIGDGLLCAQCRPSACYLLNGRWQSTAAVPTDSSPAILWPERPLKVCGLGQYLKYWHPAGDCPIGEQRWVRKPQSGL